MNLQADIYIRNNSIDQGRYSDGVNPKTYNYDHNMWTYGSSVIEGNSLLNPNASADMLNITDGSCTVRNNKFIRNTVSINSYIRHHNSGGPGTHSGIHNITDNTFDYSTIDGVNIQLVIGLNPGTVYTRNRNQIGYMYFPLTDNDKGVSSLGTANVPPGYTTDEFNITGVGEGNIFIKPQQNLMTVLVPNSGATHPEYINFMRSFALGNYLEKGMAVTGIRIGGFVREGSIDAITPPTTYYFKTYLVVYDGSTHMDAKSAFNIRTTLDFGTFNSTFIIDSDAKSALLTTDTQYGISVSNGAGGFADGNFHGFIYPDFYRVGNGYELELRFEIFIKMTVSAYAFYLSPIEIQYTW